VTAVAKSGVDTEPQKTGVGAQVAPLVVAILVGAWVVFVALPSFGPVRQILAWPLVVDDADASGDAAYVLAGGNSLLERLPAAVRLYHAGRVPLLLLQRDDRSTGPDPATGEPRSAGDWAVAYLEWRGVPRDRIRVIEPAPPSALGTLSEGRNVAARLPDTIRRLVIVTSAAHTRRALLAFRRRLPREVTVTVRAASPFADSLEMHGPLWIEYAKLCVYYVIA
jgi:uncharacterized SAM-binding protein YcdF (DUF218 family)